MVVVAAADSSVMHGFGDNGAGNSYGDSDSYGDGSVRGIRQKKRLHNLLRAATEPVFRQHGEFLYIVFFYKKRLLAIETEEEIKKPIVLKGTGFLKCRPLGRAPLAAHVAASIRPAYRARR